MVIGDALVASIMFGVAYLANGCGSLLAEYKDGRLTWHGPPHIRSHRGQSHASLGVAAKCR